MAEDTSRWGFETRAIHAGQRPDPQTGSVIVPIYATATFAQGLRFGFEFDFEFELDLGADVFDEEFPLAFLSSSSFSCFFRRSS